MSLLITISGRYSDPESTPLTDMKIVFETIYNSSQTQLQTVATTTTNSDGGYSISLVPDAYRVSEIDSKGRKKLLGNIQIFADSAPGTLNEYLTAFTADQAQPGILAEMQEILEETKQAAANPGVIPRGAFDEAISYSVNDLVEFQGSEYLATKETIGIAPPESPWQLFVAAGAEGVQGPAGETGAKGQQGEKGDPGEGAEGTVVYKGLYQYGETYSLNDVVKLSTDGQYICVVETTTTIPGQSTDWQYTGGNINTIDGLGADENGDMTCNILVDVNQAVVEPSLAGAASMTLNISSSVTVDLTAFVNPLYNTNPAAILRLVISAGDAIVITFTGSDNYWGPDGTYGTEPPVFNITAATPTIIEAINITHSAAPGVRIQQTYPLETSGSSGGDIVIPEFNMPGCQAYCSYNGVTTAEIKPGETIQGGELRFSGIASNEDLGIVNSTVAVLGTLQCRGYVFGDYATIECVASFVRIDGTNLMPVSHMLQATAASTRVRNCRYATVDNSIIDCEVLVREKWYPFSASPDDRTSWGPAIYAAALAGQFGDIESYM